MSRPDSDQDALVRQVRRLQERLAAARARASEHEELLRAARLSIETLRRQLAQSEAALESLREELEEERTHSGLVERLCSEVYDELHARGLRKALMFPVDETGRALFEALPGRFTFDALLETASSRGMGSEEAARQLATYQRLDMVRAHEDGETSGTVLFLKTGKRPFF